MEASAGSGGGSGMTEGSGGGGHSLSSFNEQALSNLVAAFEGTLGLDAELMRPVFVVAARRVERSSTNASFKPKV